MADFFPIEVSLTGGDIGNDVLRELYDGSQSLEQVEQWVRELRAEGHGVLAQEVECRLPSLQ